MKKTITLLLIILSISQIYCGSGKIKFKNNTHKKIEIKFITKNDLEYSNIINPNDLWIKELSQTLGTPDIEKMWVKFPAGVTIDLNGYNATEKDLDYRYWKKDINIKNNKITTVNINYNKDKNRFERQIYLDGKIIEKNTENIGSPESAEMLFKNETSLNLIIHLMLISEDWKTINLKPKNIFKIKVGKSNLQTRNVDHMTIEFKDPTKAEKNGFLPEQRWWPDTIKNKKKQQTIVSINYDDVNKRFTRIVYRKDQVKEKLDTNLGTKFTGSYLDLPVRPKQRQLEIISQIAKLESQIILLQGQKATLKATKQAAIWILEKIKLSALGFQKFAEKAAEGLLRLINIKKALWQGSIKEITQGKLPLFHMEYEIIGSPKTMNIQFDFKNPQNTFKEMGDSINSGIQDRMQKALEEEKTETVEK